jgi:hypothetical protein
VQPRGTSHTCPQCGHYDRRNRPEPEIFLCQRCGYTGPCDIIAGRNIKSRYWTRNLLRLYPNGSPVALGSSVTTPSTAPKSVLVQESTIPVAKKMFPWSNLPPTSTSTLRPCPCPCPI